jgi:uncharacterized membrane protein HdeD (DUF308 family)
MHTGKFIGGLVLLVVGLLAFSDAIDLWDVDELWRFWPVALIVAGIANEVEALRQRTSNGGFVLIASGTWLLCATQRFLGLHYVSAMPIGLAVIGVGMIVHSIVDVKKKENESERC